MRTIDESFQSMISKRYGIDFSNLKANKQTSLQEALNEAEEADARCDYNIDNDVYTSESLKESHNQSLKSAKKLIRVNTNESLDESNLNEWTANHWTVYSKDGKSYKDFNKVEDFLSFIDKYSDKIGKVSSNECQPIDLQKFWSYTDMQRGELFNITPQQYGHYFPDKSITNYGKVQLKNQYESFKSAKELIRVNRNDSLKESHNPSLKSVKRLMGFNENESLNEMVDNTNEIGDGRIFVPDKDENGMIYSKQLNDCRDIKPAKIFEDTDEDLEGSIEFDPKASNNEYVGKTLKAASDISYCKVDEWEDEDHSMSDLNKCGLRKDNDYIVIPKGTQMKFVGKPDGYSRFEFNCGMTLDFDGDKFNLNAGNTIDEGIKDTFNRIGKKLNHNETNDMDDQLDSWLVFDFINRDYDVIPMDKAPNGNDDVKEYCKAKGIKCDKIVPCKKNQASQIAQLELKRHFQNAKQNVDKFNAQQDREDKQQNRDKLDIRGSFSQREKDTASIEKERALYNQKKLGN